MNKKLIYTLFIFLGLQSFSQKQDKYWYYKERFNKYFINIGEGPLRSVPIERRNDFMSTKIAFGDGGVNLGWYISVLATEYRLLKNNNQKVNKTLQELYYAMLTYERYDKCENNEPWNKSEAILNGYFNRKDVEIHLGPMDNITGWNNDLDPNIDAYSSLYTNPMPYYITNSNIEPAFYGLNLKEVEMSQDQAIGLLMGFAFIKRCFNTSDDVNPGFFDLNGNWKNYNFKEKAIKFSRLITLHVQNHAFDNWTIMNPEFNQVDPGGAALANAYGFIRAAQYIDDSWPYVSGTAPLTLPIWLSQTFPQSPLGFETIDTLLHGYNTTMAMALATIGDSWSAVEGTALLLSTGGCSAVPGMFPGVTLPATCAVISARAMAGTAKNLQRAGSPFNRQHIYIPMFMFLHDREVSSDIYEKQKIINMLDAAPCGGPYMIPDNFHSEQNYQFPAHPTGGWASTNRFRVGIDEQNGENFNDVGEQNGFQGFFNGLDYMLLYNLYHLLENPEPYVNLLDRNISDSYPQTLHSTKISAKNFMGTFTQLSYDEDDYETGSVTNPLVVQSLNKIESTAKLDNIDHHTEISIVSTTITTPLSPNWCTESVSNTLHCAGCVLIGWVNPSCWGENYIELTNNTNTTNEGAKTSDLTLIAKERIILKPGFLAKNGCHFLAKIENNYCGTNIYKQTPYVTAYDSAYWNSSQIVLYPEPEPYIPEPQVEVKTDEIKENYIKIYPNPTKGQITVESTKGIITNILITNTFGAIILRKQANTTQKQINISNLQQGVYFVKVITETGESFIQKIVKQ